MLPNNLVTEERNLVHLALFIEAEPVTIEETIKDEKWLNAMKKELNSIERNHIGQLVSLPQHKRPIAVKWVYKIKRMPDRIIAKYKTRLIAKEFLQKGGVNFMEETNIDSSC